jgi:hypothetical protein
MTTAITPKAGTVNPSSSVSTKTDQAHHDGWQRRMDGRRESAKCDVSSYTLTVPAPSGGSAQ